jgi:transglutaminase-like putative cysteine protease
MQWVVTPLLAAASVFFVYLLWQRGASLPVPLPTSAADVRNELSTLKAADHVSPDEAQKIAKALTPLDALTRDTAVKIAARTEGPFHVEQVAEIWNSVRGAWRYVNDPQGHEYFATATETIQNGYVGDCDDFATALASMVIAIGGKARVIIMDGPEGGHAYTEACVQGEPPKVAAELIKYYRSRWSKYLAGRPVPRTIAYRTSDDCPIWLNLDWNSFVPGGAYQAEQWAVAIYEDGHSEALAAAGPPPEDAKKAQAR